MRASLDQPDAVGDADFLHAHAPGKVDHILDAGAFHVARSLGTRRFQCQLLQAGIAVIFLLDFRKQAGFRLYCAEFWWLFAARLGVAGFHIAGVALRCTYFGGHLLFCHVLLPF